MVLDISKIQATITREISELLMTQFRAIQNSAANKAR
jgi:hypothetical protein